MIDLFKKNEKRNINKVKIYHLRWFKIAYYIRMDGNVIFYSDKGITVGYIRPINMPIGVVGLIEDKSPTKKRIDLVSTLKVFEQACYPPEILAKIVASGDVTVFQEWLKKFPNFYEPGILFMMYLLEQRHSDRIIASAITTSLHDPTQKPSSYRAFFVGGQHSIGLVRQNDTTDEITADASAFAKLGSDTKARFGNILNDLKVELPISTYSQDTGKATVGNVVVIHPRKGIESLLT